MNFTAYHSKYFTYEFTGQRPSNDIGKLTSSLQDAQVDLNPHKVKPAWFTVQSPLSQGAILADEVGLGKLIDADIILSQQRAERENNYSRLNRKWDNGYE